jgi:hypothetical protein
MNFGGRFSRSSVARVVTARSKAFCASSRLLFAARRALPEAVAAAFRASSAVLSSPSASSAGW